MQKWQGLTIFIGKLSKTVGRLLFHKVDILIINMYIFVQDFKVLVVTFLLIHNNTMLKNEHKTLDSKLSTSYIPKALKLDHKIVIAYELEPPDHRKETKDPLSSPELLIMSKHYLYFLFLI